MGKHWFQKRSKTKEKKKDKKNSRRKYQQLNDAELKLSSIKQLTTEKAKRAKHKLNT